MERMLVKFQEISPMPTPKHAFLAALECATKGWRAQHEGSGTPAPADQWRFWQGQEVHRRARAWLGAGRYLQRTPQQTAAEVTREALADPANTLLHEATFEAHGCVARADALRRLGAGWELIEIKSASSKEEKELTQEHVDDVAYTTAVAQAAGLTVHRVSLIMVNGDYVHGTGDHLLVTVDVTAEAMDRAAEFTDILPEVAGRLAGERPEACLVYVCRRCAHFAEDCVGHGVDDPLFDLPYLRESRWQKLIVHGERIRDLPDDADLTDNQVAYVQVLRSGQPMVDLQVLGQLDGMTWPLYYLDFEAIAPAIPVFEGTRPYQKHPFQFSLHVRQQDGTTEHHEYLATTAHDWRRDLATRLLELLGTSGSIVVYSSYEEQVLKQLAEWFPELAAPITRVIERLFDLEKVVRKGYVHPRFRGKSSIKKVLPVMAPECTYDGMDVADGEHAAAVFGFMWIGEYPSEDHEKHRTALLEYCKLDTEAMVRVHEGLEAVRGA